MSKISKIFFAVVGESSKKDEVLKLLAGNFKIPVTKISADNIFSSEEIKSYNYSILMLDGLTENQANCVKKFNNYFVLNFNAEELYNLKNVILVKPETSVDEIISDVFACIDDILYLNELKEARI